MSTFTKSVFALSVAAALSCSAASAAVVVNGYQWDYAYTADTTPANASPAWELVSQNAGGTSSVADGNLTVVTATDGGNLFLRQTGSEWNPQTGQTTYIEIRMKVTGEGGINIGDGSGVNKNRQVLIWFREGQIRFNGIGSTVGAITDVDYSQWHTYRITYTPGADKQQFWVDDFDAAPLMINNDANWSTTRLLSVGDFSNATRGTFVIDYIAWNNNGAPLVIPEPASLGVALLGASALMLRRR